MAIINEGGGASRKPDRREKDDVYTPPVHKTEDFKQTVKKIKEGQPVAPSSTDDFATRHPDFKINIPIPGSSSMLPPKKSGPHHSSLSFNQSLYDKELEKAVRAKVIKELPAAPMGASQQQVESRI